MCLDLEKLISSSCRRKIIKFLWKTNYINVMELVLKTNSTYNQVNANLLILSQEGIIEEKRYGRVRMIKLNRENPKTLLLLQAFKILNT
jgi:hypothetical protein